MPAWETMLEQMKARAKMKTVWAENDDVASVGVQKFVLYGDHMTYADGGCIEQANEGRHRDSGVHAQVVYSLRVVNVEIHELNPVIGVGETDEGSIRPQRAHDCIDLVVSRVVVVGVSLALLITVVPTVICGGQHFRCVVQRRVELMSHPLNGAREESQGKIPRLRITSKLINNLTFMALPLFQHFSILTLHWTYNHLLEKVQMVVGGAGRTTSDPESIRVNASPQ